MYTGTLKSNVRNLEFQTGMVSHSFIHLVRVGDGRSSFDSYQMWRNVSRLTIHRPMTETNRVIDGGGGEVMRVRMAAVDAPEVWNGLKMGTQILTSTADRQG